MTAILLLLESRSALGGGLGAPVPVMALHACRGDTVPGIHLAITQQQMPGVLRLLQFAAQPLQLLLLKPPRAT